MDTFEIWFDRAFNAVIASLLVATVGLLGMIAYQALGEAPRQARQDEAAWRERCITKGGSLIPTETAWAKGRGTYYTGWICARIERLDP